MALGGSTNTVLHLMAIANEAQAPITLKDFDRLSKTTPHLCNMRPGGETFMEDLDHAGGIPAILKRLTSKLNDCITVSGRNIKRIANEATIFDANIIRPIDKPFHKEGGIRILYGNLAEDGCVVKQSAVDKEILSFQAYYHAPSLPRP